MPLRVIIVAILLLIVLVIVIFLLMGGISKFQSGIKDCKAKGGRDCINSSYSEPTNPGHPCKKDEIPVSGICDEGYVCCLPT